jgi:hypothetical protein
MDSFHYGKQVAHANDSAQIRRTSELLPRHTLSSKASFRNSSNRDGQMSRHGAHISERDECLHSAETWKN